MVAQFLAEMMGDEKNARSLLCRRHRQVFHSSDATRDVQKGEAHQTLSWRRKGMRQGRGVRAGGRTGCCGCRP
eukprot:763243-Hanusia_phi.AAC.3